MGSVAPSLRDGWRFDIGGHRFFTKVKAVDDLWWEILGAENFLRRRRQSRIFYKGKLYDYPLVPMKALRNLGLIEAVRCAASYLWVRVHPPKNRDMLEGFYASRFGWRLYRHFFKTYNEKVWGVPTSEMSADFGAQRVKELSLFRAVFEGLKPKRLRGRDKQKVVTSLIEEFNYPKYGPGMMWETAAEKVTAAGVRLHIRERVTAIHHQAGGAYEVLAVDADGIEHAYPATHVVSSMPMSELLGAMDPAVDDTTRAAADDLRYRDFMTVALVVPQEFSFSDTWIYIHDPDVEVGRVQNFGSWSPYMVKDGGTCLGLEFFVNEGDEMWAKSDAELVQQATRELHYLGLITSPEKVEQGFVVRVPKAYPVYDEHYEANVEIMRKWLDANAPNVFPCGRNGMHKYNNQDHSMLTAMLSVENILGARARRVVRQRRSRVPRGDGRRGERRGVPAATRRSCPGVSSSGSSTGVANPPLPDIGSASAAPPIPAVLRPHYPCLEGLRTIGVMALFFQHTGYSTGLQTHSGFGWMGHFEIGPTMFFVLSAFLLYQPFVGANFSERAPQRWTRFIKARAFRVVPAYWITLTLLILFFRAQRNNPFSAGVKIDGWRDGVAVYGFAQTYFPKYFFHGITSSYTLNAEVVFYLLVPVYALVIRHWASGRTREEKLRVELYGLAAVVVASFAWRAAIELIFRHQRETLCLTPRSHISCAAIQWFPGYADYFALGMAVAVFAAWRSHRGGDTPLMARIGAMPNRLWLAAGVLFVVYSATLGTHGLATPGPLKSEARHLVNGLIALCLLLPGVFGDQDRGAVRWFLRWRPIAYIGLVSFGVYLWHQGFTDKAMEWTNSRPLHANFLLITGLAVAFSVVSATLSWYFLERPINRRRNLPIGRWFRPSPPAP